MQQCVRGLTNLDQHGYGGNGNNGNDHRVFGDAVSCHSSPEHPHYATRYRPPLAKFKLYRTDVAVAYCRFMKGLKQTGNWLATGLVATAIVAVAFVYVRWRYREQRWNALIEQIAPRYGVDKFLVKAVMRQESGFDPLVVSSKGAIGLMQVMEATGADWARATGQRGFSSAALGIPQYNIEAGTWYLARALDYWRKQGAADPLAFALAEYNAGRGNAQRWWAQGQITHAGVRHYIRRVLEFYEYYRARGEL